MVKLVPQADAKSASMGWFFDPGFIQNVQRVAADVEDPSMESIDSVLFALREMGYIRTAETCEHGFSVDECVDGMCELQAEGASLRSRVARLEEALREIRDYDAYKHPDESFIAVQDAAIKESTECTACQHAKTAKCPLSGLCAEHYRTVTRAEDRVKQMFEYKQTWEQREIARRALEPVRRSDGVGEDGRGMIPDKSTIYMSGRVPQVRALRDHVDGYLEFLQSIPEAE